MQKSNETASFSYLEELEKYSGNFRRIAETLLEKQDTDLATSAKDIVFREDSMVLYHLRPTRPVQCPVPLLITYALVNRETMMDLEEGTSLIRKLLDQGIDIYMMAWGYPTRADRYTTLDDYIDIYMDDCVEHIRKACAVPSINLMGVCQGGTFSAIYASLYPEKVRNLITMVTPIDFHTGEGLLNMWARHMDVDLMVDAFGNIPGDLLNFIFLMLKPFQLAVDKYVGFVEGATSPDAVKRFLRMEKWIFDSPDLAGEAFRKFVNEMFQKNSLIKGELRISGRTVDLKKIDMPVLNIYAELDHLVPPSSSKGFGTYVSSKDFTNQSFAVGHIGVYVSGKTKRELAPLISGWLTQRSALSGRRPPAHKAA